MCFHVSLDGSFPSFSSVIFPPEASALLSNPNSGLPRTPTAALRRATPRVNMETSDIQYNLDDAAYQFRIPQRKPWNSMLNEIKKAKETAKGKRVEIFQPIVKEKIKQARKLRLRIYSLPWTD